MNRLRSIDDLQVLRARLIAEDNEARRPVIRVCCGTGCAASGGVEAADAFSEEIEKRGSDIELVRTGCQGWCENGPLVAIEPQHLFYQRVTPIDVPEIMDLTVSRGRPINRFLYTKPESGEVVPWRDDVPFYQKQMRIILRNCGEVGYDHIYESIKAGGYEALAKVLSSMTPEEVIDTIKRSNLRGRGGAGFPTGVKWESCRGQKGKVKYLICNGDEGDPGAFMDRSVLEGDPHSVIEGMIIAAYAIGDISQGLIYVRAEYPLAVINLGQALYQAEELGLLGENILGSGFSFDIEIKRGAGAFVCGESTAMMRAIEDRRGMPRQTPPRSVEVGLWSKPTVLNNVKTFATVPVIISRGVKWFTSIGTENSKGTQVFALTGKVKNTGLIELPMGTTIREIVFDIGGGVLDDKRFKAVQIGGPSGGCIPEEFLDTPIDFESLTSLGAMMGSGGLVVMDEDSCMVDVAKFFTQFTSDESCGKCLPCRAGTPQMLEILNKISQGEGTMADLNLLSELAEMIASASLCGLGQSAPNPFLTTIRYFQKEYEAHINEKRCPALVCKELIRYYILPDKCQGCGICLRDCPTEAISGGRRLVHIIDQNKCVKCGVCLDVCPARFNAVVKSSGEEIPIPSEPIPVTSSRKN